MLVFRGVATNSGLGRWGGGGGQAQIGTFFVSEVSSRRKRV